MGSRREEGLGAKVRTAEAGAGRYDGLGDGAESALDAFVGDVLGLPDVGLNFLL